MNLVLRNTVVAVDELLRTAQRSASLWARLPQVSPLLLILALGGVYGAAMASFGGLSDERALGIVFSAIKVPMLFGCTLLIAVPCFYVLNALFGVADDFREVWSALVDFQLLVALQLGALSPVTVFLNCTHSRYSFAQLWSILVFAVCAWTARRALRSRYLKLERRNPVHRRLRYAWFLIYSFVGIQLGWVLRPFVGSPDMPVQFFRDHIGNAYVHIGGVIAKAVGQLLGV